VQRDSRDAWATGSVYCCRSELLCTAAQSDKANCRSVQVFTVVYCIREVLVRHITYDDNNRHIFIASYSCDFIGAENNSFLYIYVSVL